MVVSEYDGPTAVLRARLESTEGFAVKALKRATRPVILNFIFVTDLECICVQSLLVSGWLLVLM